MSETKHTAERVRAYLQDGGLFNPELANHDVVRDLIIDLRNYVDQLTAQHTALLEACKAAEKMFHDIRHWDGRFWQPQIIAITDQLRAAIAAAEPGREG